MPIIVRHIQQIERSVRVGLVHVYAITLNLNAIIGQAVRTNEHRSAISRGCLHSRDNWRDCARGEVEKVDDNVHVLDRAAPAT